MVSDELEEVKVVEESVLEVKVVEEEASNRREHMLWM